MDFFIIQRETGVLSFQWLYVHCIKLTALVYDIIILQVHLCEAENVTEFLGDDFLVNRTTGSQSMLVAVKMLRPEADELSRYVCWQMLFTVLFE